MVNYQVMLNSKAFSKDLLMLSVCSCHKFTLKLSSAPSISDTTDIKVGRSPNHITVNGGFTGEYISAML